MASSSSSPALYGVLEFSAKDGKAYPVAWGFATEREARAFAQLLNDMEATIDKARAKTIEYIPHGRPGTRVSSARGSPRRVYDLPAAFEPGNDRTRILDYNMLFTDEYHHKSKRRNEARARVESSFFFKCYAMLMGRPEEENVTVESPIRLRELDPVELAIATGTDTSSTTSAAMMQ